MPLTDDETEKKKKKKVNLSKTDCLIYNILEA